MISSAKNKPSSFDQRLGRLWDERKAQGGNAPMADKEIADATGVSREYIAKLASQALAKVTAAFAELGLSEFELEQAGLKAARHASTEVEFSLMEKPEMQFWAIDRSRDFSRQIAA